MTAEIPADMTSFVEQMVAQRRFLTAEEVLTEGLRLLQAREALGQEIRAGFDELDSGLGIPAEDVYLRAERHIHELAN